MKKLLVFIFVLSLLSLHSQAQVQEAGVVMWETNYAEAVAKAKREYKTLLLNFTGSDWCSWCIKLDKEVFSKDEFKKYAEENLVLVKLDFPRRKILPQSEQEQNKEIGQKYNVRAFPTILLLDKNEELLWQTNYHSGGVKKFIQSLQTNIGKR